MEAMGRPCLTCQPSSRTGENPPYGMIGGMVETSASFEARYAPLSHPTLRGWDEFPVSLLVVRFSETGLRRAVSRSK